MRWSNWYCMRAAPRTAPDGWKKKSAPMIFWTSWASITGAWMKADTMEDCHVIDACLNATVCKNLFLCNRQKTNFYLLMMPGNKPFKTKELSHQLGIARLSFASPEDMEQYLDCTPGSSSIMGLMNDPENHVQLLLDKDVKAGEFIGCHPCINTSSLKLYTKDIFETFLPAVHHEPIFVELTGE